MCSSDLLERSRVGLFEAFEEGLDELGSLLGGEGEGGLQEGVVVGGGHGFMGEVYGH